MRPRVSEHGTIFCWFCWGDYKIEELLVGHQGAKLCYECAKLAVEVFEGRVSATDGMSQMPGVLSEQFDRRFRET